MIQDEIRKLLGGYATDALTPEERRILFQAALENQEIFDALQHEDALRELVADPVSRTRLRRALETPNRRIRKREFSWRRWLLGVAAPAMVAVIVVVMMNRANAPKFVAFEPKPTLQPPAQSKVAPRELASTVQPQQAEAKKEAVVKPQHPEASPKVSARPAPEPAVPAQTQLAASRAVPDSSANGARPNLAAPAMEALRAVPARIPNAILQQFSTSFVATAPPYQGPLVQYSLLRSGPNGGEVRVAVTPQIDGYVGLYSVDGTGAVQRIYPTNGPAARVFRGVPIQIPNTAVKMAGAVEKLRLVVVPAGSPVAVGIVGGVVNGTSLGTGAAPIRPTRTPLVIDIPLAPH